MWQIWWRIQENSPFGKEKIVRTWTQNANVSSCLFQIIYLVCRNTFDHYIWTKYFVSKLIHWRFWLPPQNFVSSYFFTSEIVVFNSFLYWFFSAIFCCWFAMFSHLLIHESELRNCAVDRGNGIITKPYDPNDPTNKLQLGVFNALCVMIIGVFGLVSYCLYWIDFK